MTVSPAQLDHIRSALAGSDASFGIPLDWHASVESTMPLAWRLADDPAASSGAAVVADEQTAGKGRQGRTWVAPPGLGLLASFVVRRARHAVALNRLHMATALAIVDLCRHAGIEPTAILCKWPNDVVLLDASGSAHKVAGILVETRLAGAAWECAVLGMGVNVNQQEEELPPQFGAALPATSLWRALASGAEHPTPPLDRADLLITLCRTLTAAFDQTDAAILERWRSLLWIPQGQVVVVGEGEQYVGAMVGADDEGALLLRDAAGTLHHLAAGDLSLRPLQP